MRSGGFRSSSLSNRNAVDASYKPLYLILSPPLRMTHCYALVVINLGSII